MRNLNVFSKINFIPEQNIVKPLINFALENSSPYILDNTKKGAISESLEKVLNFLATKKVESIFNKHMSLEILKDSECIVFSIKNESSPIYLSDIKGVETLKHLSDRYEFINLGREGQVLNIFHKICDSSQNLTHSKELKSGNGLHTKHIRPTEADKISKLFFSTYGPKYINEDVYFPERLNEFIADEKLISLGVFNEDEDLLAHVGLLKHNESPKVYEAALGVVDPNIKGKGLFKTLFKNIVELVEHTPMQYCVYDLVTNHDYSQREVAKYGMCELSIHVGAQISDTQAKLETLGIGKDAEDMDRYSLLMAIKPQVERPLGSSVVMPIHLGEKLDFLLEPLGIDWIPASRFCPLRRKGEYSIIKQEVQKSVFFDFFKPGQDCLEKIISDWNYFLKLGYLYAAIDIPISYPGLGQLYDFFAGHGFFISGFIPLNFGNQIGFRLQALGPTRVSFENIKIATRNGKKLLEIIKKDCQRNGFYEF